MNIEEYVTLQAIRDCALEALRQKAKYGGAFDEYNAFVNLLKTRHGFWPLTDEATKRWLREFINK